MNWLYHNGKCINCNKEGDKHTEQEVLVCKASILDRLKV